MPGPVLRTPDYAQVLSDLLARVRALETQPLRVLSSGLSDPSMAIDLGAPSLTVKDAAHVTRALLSLSGLLLADANGNTTFDSSPGSPSITLRDGSNVIRVQLSTNGLQVYDGSGNTILDSNSGQIMQSAVPSLATGYSTGNPFSLTWAVAPSTTTAAFTVGAGKTRTFLVLGQIPFVSTGGTANYVQVRLAVYNGANVLQTASSVGWHTQNSGVSNGHLYKLVTLAAGTYYVRYEYLMNGGAATTVEFEQGAVDVFLLGG